MNNRKIFYQAVIPSMLAFALSGIYSVADGFFVGNSLGDNALAAINIAYPLTAFIQAVGTGIGMGGAGSFLGFPCYCSHYPACCLRRFFS